MSQITVILERNLLPLGVAQVVIDQIASEIICDNSAKQNEYRCEYIKDGIICYDTIVAKDYTDAWLKFREKHPNHEPRNIVDII